MQNKTKSLIGSLMVLAMAGVATARAEETLRFATWDTDESLAIQQAIAKKFEEKHRA